MKSLFCRAYARHIDEACRNACGCKGRLFLRDSAKVAGLRLLVSVFFHIFVRKSINLSINQLYHDGISASK